MLLRGMTASAETFDDDLLGDVRPVILLLLLASALVMLVAIVNVGALFLALELARRQDSPCGWRWAPRRGASCCWRSGTR